MTEQRLQPPYDPSCVECRRDAGKDSAGTTWQCVGHVYLERDRLRADLAQARAERDEARLEVIGAVARKEAAQAENAALRAALTAAQELLELPETCVVCSAILEPREDEAPHCYDCVVTDEHEAERQDRITQLEIALAQAAPAQASGL